MTKSVERFRCAGMALPLLSHGVLDDLSFKALIDVNSLETPIILPQFL